MATSRYIFTFRYSFFCTGCYAQPSEETPNGTHSLSSKDPVRECRDKCQPIRAMDDSRKQVSRNPAMFFWLSDNDGTCNCLPNTPLGGKHM